MHAAKPLIMKLGLFQIENFQNDYFDETYADQINFRYLRFHFPFHSIHRQEWKLQE